MVSRIGWAGHNPINRWTRHSSSKPATSLSPKEFVFGTSHSFFEKDGQEMAVIVMDTQGTFDEYTTDRDMNRIVGLSLLLSSVTIFNIFTDLQENTLSSLTTYTEYGKITLDKSADGKNGKAFQKLQFLIRDWNNPSQYPFGKEGGTQFIQQKLRIKEHQPENARKLRESLSQCFQEINCSLLPFIGSRALTENYNGNIAELDPNFAEKMEAFVNDFVHNQLCVKEIIGDEITGHDFQSYLTTYVDAFNSSAIPSPMSIWEATALAADMSSVEKAVIQFQESFQDYRGNRLYLNPTALVQVLKSAQGDALKAFSERRIFGNAETFKGQLETKIKNESNSFKLENEKCRQDILSSAWTKSDEEFTRLFSKRFGSNQEIDYYQSSKKILKLGAMAKKEALKYYARQLSLETDDDRADKGKDLEAALDMKISVIDINNRNKKITAQRKLGDVVLEILEDFNKTMQIHNNKGDCKDLETFKKLIDSYKHKCLENFDIRVESGSNVACQTVFRSKLAHKIDSASVDILKSWEVVLEDRDKLENMVLLQEQQHRESKQKWEHQLEELKQTELENRPSEITYEGFLGVPELFAAGFRSRQTFLKSKTRNEH